MLVNINYSKYGSRKRVQSSIAANHKYLTQTSTSTSSQEMVQYINFAGESCVEKQEHIIWEIMFRNRTFLIVVKVKERAPKGSTVVSSHPHLINLTRQKNCMKFCPFYPGQTSQRRLLIPYVHNTIPFCLKLSTSNKVKSWSWD